MGGGACAADRCAARRPGAAISIGLEPVAGLRHRSVPEVGPVRRRRPLDERWKDRRESDPAIDWDVEVLIQYASHRLEAAFGNTAQTDRDIAEIARTTGAVSWDRELLDAFLADVEAWRVAAAELPSETGEEWGTMWASEHAPAWRMRYRICASTRASAAASVRGGLPTRDDWETHVHALPSAPPDDRHMVHDEEREMFDAFADAFEPVAGDDPLTAAVDALLETDAVPTVDQLLAFMDRHGLEIGDNHLSTRAVHWLPVLTPTGDSRWLMIEADDEDRVEHIHIVRIEHSVQLD